MGESERVRSLRPPKRAVDPFRPLGVHWERERRANGIVEALTIFLAGAECPFTCVFCDLWRSTLDGPTPRGAIPRQIRLAIEQASRPVDGAAVKLYNASNFFDARAVPPEDDEAIVPLLRPFSVVTVECHPRLVGERCVRFAEALGGRLEVAMGLETAHPPALARLNKRMTLDDFADAARNLRDRGIGIRVFLLVPPPFVPQNRCRTSVVESVAFAFDHGADFVSLIPARSGNGALDQLARLGDFTPPTLRLVEDVYHAALALSRGVVAVDVWDVERLALCCDCGPERVGRIRRINLSGRQEPVARCPACASSS